MKLHLNKLFFVLVFVFFQAATFAQSFTEIKRFPIDVESDWTIDGLDNIIVIHRDRLTKIDDKGKVIFDQSQKSLGKIDKIEVVNSLKFIGFSEAQQMICFFDNSLSILDKCLDLSDYEVMNASQVAASAQSDKMWVLDQVNSSLLLISMKGLLQSQKVKNLHGILQVDHIIQMNEWDNKLFILDQENGIYIFDSYGTLIRFIEIANVKSIQFYNEYLVCLLENELKFISLSDDNKPFSISLPYEQVQDFFVNDQYIYFRIPTEIIKTKLKLN